MKERTLGWVQNPGDFKKLRDVVAVFDPESDTHQELVSGKLEALIEDKELLREMMSTLNNPNGVKAKFPLLKGKGVPSGGTRRDAKCTGIIQAVLPNQKGRPYSDDWTADGFIRWAISVGFLDYSISDDTVTITDFGLQYVRAKREKDQKEFLTQALLSYPPATRVLHLLHEAPEPLTKFEIGSQLGGLGEPGFTSIPQELYVQALNIASPEERKDIRSNTEGSADKYARMIASWLVKIGLVQNDRKEVSVSFQGVTYTEQLQAWTLTLEGRKQLKRTKGVSSVSKIPKIVYWQMLATKTDDRDYLRTRRAYIIEAINGNAWTSLEKIQQHLASNGLQENIVTIEDELKVVEAIGLTVEVNRKGEYRCPDQIFKLYVPKPQVPRTKTEVLQLKDRVREKLTHIHHRYLSLIELAYLAGNTSSRDFEALTIDLLTNELDFEGLHLGGSRKPDGIISYDRYGIILDTKAYAKGYSLPINQADEMVRYIEENKSRESGRNPNRWWKHFKKEIEAFYYLFVTSHFKGSFKERLQNIYDRTSVLGGGLSVENLLYLAEALKSQKEDYLSLPLQMTNDEITYPFACKEYS